MKTERLNYSLPLELVAQAPAARRSASKLLVIDRAADRLIDSEFIHLADFLRAGDCLVLNDTKVLAARFFAQRTSGAALEGLFLTESGGERGVWEVMLKGARKVRPGERIGIKSRGVGTAHHLPGGQGIACEAELIEKRAEGVCLLKIDTDRSAESILDEIGYPPLPPYIRRDGDAAQAQVDRQRYQTVYARRPGAVAAPTAGLHFTDVLLEQVQAQGVRLASVTLHVGTGTFKPVTAEELEAHEIHREWFRLDAANAEIINAARAAGGRIVAVGTTATRVLETVAGQVVGRASWLAQSRAGTHALRAAEGETQLFITPGYEFKAVDAMITNFHLPKSTLLALVAAFAGLERTLAAYRHAVEQRYRFYSYGDAMLIL